MAPGFEIARTGRKHAPGSRIADYRNSAPRLVKLIGVGAQAQALAAEIAAATGGNVVLGAPLGQASGQLAGALPGPLDAPVSGMVPGAVIVVLTPASAPEALGHAIERTAATLSVVLLGPDGAEAQAPHAEMLRRLRGVSDMFAATSDPDFVRDLVANLAS